MRKVPRLSSKLPLHLGNDPPVPMDDLILFVQILDTSELKTGTAKIDQWQNIAKLIQKTISIKDNRIRRYVMVHGDQNQFVPTHKNGRELTKQIEEFLTKN